MQTAVYPARLLVYHAGTGRTVFIGCLKVTTIFLVAFFGLIAAPAQLSAPTLPYWRFSTSKPPHPSFTRGCHYPRLQTLSEPTTTNPPPPNQATNTIPALLTGLLPFLFVSLTTAPFVTYIHLRLPPYARYSRVLLSRYLAALPETGTVDITTVTLIGRPRVQTVALGNLEAVKPRLLSVANFRRVRRDETRPWWAGRGQSKFAVNQAYGKGVKMGWVWEEVAAAIRGGKLRDGNVNASTIGKSGVVKAAVAGPRK
jgi:hypothetical protein